VTPQEEQLLDSLVAKINQTQLQEKDPDAEALLNRGAQRQPGRALHPGADGAGAEHRAGAGQGPAYGQAAAADRPVTAAGAAPGACGELPGQFAGAPGPCAASPAAADLPCRHSRATLRHSSKATFAPPPPPPGYDPQYAQPQYGPPQYGPPQYVPAGQPSFLRGAMQTAAGVAAGALAFEGVEAVLHGIRRLRASGVWATGWAGLGMGPGIGMGTGDDGRGH
jgi:hypothetical protein